MPNSLSCLSACSLAYLTAHLPGTSSSLPVFLSACLSACHLSCQHVCLHIIFPVSMSFCMSSFLSVNLSACCYCYWKCEKMRNFLAHLKLQGPVLPDCCRFPWASCTCSNTNYSLRIFTISFFHCACHMYTPYFACARKKVIVSFVLRPKLKKQTVSKIFKNTILWIKKMNRHAIGELCGVFSLYI